MKKRGVSLSNRLNILIVLCVIPLTSLLVYLLVLTYTLSSKYDNIVEQITKANTYNINFKEDVDYVMYIIVVNSARAEELVDTEEPQRMIDEAREVFQNLYDEAENNSTKTKLDRILACLDTLETHVVEIEQDALVPGMYETNIDRLDLDVRVLTELIQEQIQEYIYEQSQNLEGLRQGVHREVQRAILIMSLLLGLILISVVFFARRITRNIAEPISELCDVAATAGEGDFEIRTKGDNSIVEIQKLNTSVNQMIKKIGQLVDDIRVEEINLRAAELRLLQEQINPHFLYNTLDNIIWLAESGEDEEVVKMVSSLSSFFRTTLSKGRDYITIAEEREHIESYLSIQKFRYRDILPYDIDFEDEILDHSILKLTLQPIVENALYHGIKNKRGMGHIQIDGRMAGDNIEFIVSDNGIGMREEEAEHLRKVISGLVSDDRSGGGFGLFNVNQRLQLNYGKEYGLNIESTYNVGTTIRVKIPAVKKQTL